MISNITIEEVVKLRNKSGDCISRCKHALEVAEGDMDVAYEYLRLTMQALCRRKIVNGVLVAWQEEDYVRQAYKDVAEARKTVVDK